MNATANPQLQQIRTTSAALRERSAGLRARSRTLRELSFALRRRAGHVRPAPIVCSPDPGAPLPPLDPVPVAELRDVLVRHHGLAADRADRALQAGLLVAGYPAGYDRVAAADAFDLVQGIITRPW